MSFVTLVIFINHPLNVPYYIFDMRKPKIVVEICVKIPF
jgi:hypothetical protein